MNHPAGSRQPSSSFTNVAVPLVVLLLAVGARALAQALPSLEALANVSALPAIAFAAGYLLRRWWAPVVVIAAMVAVDLWIDPASVAAYWPSIATAYLLLLGLGVWGLRLPSTASNGGILGRSALACGGFYLLTNTLSWLTTAAYAKTFGGWWQAVTVGLPGLRPTWSFGLTMLASTLLLTAVILALFRRRHAWLPAAEWTPAAATTGR